MAAPRSTTMNSADVATCPHCTATVLVVVMRSSRKTIRLDPTPRPDGSFQLLEQSTIAVFIPREGRDAKSRWFVPVEERYVSHRATCPANERTLSSADARFIAKSTRRLAGADR